MDSKDPLLVSGSSISKQMWTVSAVMILFIITFVVVLFFLDNSITKPEHPTNLEIRHGSLLQ